MGVIAFVSGRSPGLTTAVHALALSWPSPRRALVVEHDTDGGCLAPRHELPAEPGLTTLAAAGRRGLSPDLVVEHCQHLADGTAVLLAPINPDLAESALSVLGSAHLADALAALPDTDALVDCGRVTPSGPARPLIESAGLVVLVVTPTVEGVAHVQARLSGLGWFDLAQRVVVLTIGRKPYGPDEVADALGLPALGALADDRRGALELATGRTRPRHRSELLRSAVVVAEEIAGRLGEDVGRLGEDPALEFPPTAEPATPVPPWR